MTNTTKAPIVVGFDQDDEGENPFTLVFLTREVWEQRDAWAASYADVNFAPAMEKLESKFDLDAFMENYWQASSADDYENLLDYLKASDDFELIVDLYDPTLILVDGVYTNVS